MTRHKVDSARPRAAAGRHWFSAVPAVSVRRARYSSESRPRLDLHPTTLSSHMSGQARDLSGAEIFGNSV